MYRQENTNNIYNGCVRQWFPGERRDGSTNTGCQAERVGGLVGALGGAAQVRRAETVTELYTFAREQESSE